jgi:succinate dehydrogenase / fumarate reductase cytochrome b subunit
VTTATATDFTAPLIGGRHHFLLRRLHSLTGILFGGYIVIHLLVNASLIEGVRSDGAIPAQQTVFQTQVDKIHSLPFLVVVEWTFIYLPILFHTFYGLWIIATGQPNANRYGYSMNWAYVAQRLSAIILVFFIAFHVLSMKGFFGSALTFDPTKATQTTVNHFHAHWWVGYIVYPIGIVSATFHLANGFYTAAITWGLTISAGAQRRWGLACCGLFVLVSLFGLTALFAALRGTPDYNLQNVANVREAHG